MPDIQELIEELTKVRPEQLSKEGLKLFEKINEIIDRNKELEEELEHWKFTAKYVENNYIDKQKAKAKIDKCKFFIAEYNGEFVAIEDLQELLNKGE